MGRKNETARLKINTNNGRGNAPRLYTCTIPACVYMYYAHTYYIPTPPPHPRHKFWKIRPRTTATHDPLVRFIYRSGMQQHTYYCCACACLPRIICVRYNNMRIKVPPLYVGDKTQFLRRYQKKNLQIRRTSAS